MKLKKIYSLSLAAMLLAAPTCTAWAQQNSVPASNHSESYISLRFAYIISASIKVNTSSSGVNYSVRVSSISEVTSISGTMTIYKDGSEIYTKKLSANKSKLRASGTIPTKGSGTYKITFSGTVYAKFGSELMDMEDSY